MNNNRKKQYESTYSKLSMWIERWRRGKEGEKRTDAEDVGVMRSMMTVVVMMMMVALIIA